MAELRPSEESMHRDTDVIIGLISGALITLIFWLIEVLFSKPPSLVLLTLFIIGWGFFLFYVLLDRRNTISETSLYGVGMIKIIFAALILSAIAIFVLPG
jgi:hypothetical protein